MAIIKMDVSEYEAMKNNSKLLEASLVKERELQESIRELHKKNLTALEDAKMKVVKVTTIARTDHLLRRKPSSDPRFQRLLWIIREGDVIDFDGPLHKDLEECFFEKVTSHSEGDSTVTTHGLDEIRAELRADIKANMSAEHIYKLEAADKALSKNAELITNNKALSTSNTYYEKTNKALLEKLTTADEEVNVLVTKLRDYCEIMEIVKDGYGFRGKAKMLDEIISLTK